MRTEAVSPMLGAGPDPATLLETLREARRRAAGLSGDERRWVVRCCLAYHLKDTRHEAVSALLTDLLRRCGGGAPHRLAPSAGESVEARRTLARLLARYGDVRGEEPPSDRDLATEAERVLEGVCQRLEVLAGAERNTEDPVSALLDRVERRLSSVDTAASRSAQEFFDRLLEGFDPDAAKAHVGKKGMKPAAFRKAAAYDALKEKFAQLAEYHQRGRLVRDFRASFRVNLKKKSVLEEGP